MLTAFRLSHLELLLGFLKCQLMPAQGQPGDRLDRLGAESIRAGAQRTTLQNPAQGGV